MCGALLSRRAGEELKVQFRQNASIYTLDGKNVGRIDRIVLDPQTKDVTHLVVRTGFLLSEARVVPVDQVVAATDRGVTLWGDVSDLKALPLFEEAHDIRATGDLPSGALGGAPPLDGYPLFGNVPLFGQAPPRAAADPSRLPTIEYEQNIPDGTVALKEGANVIAADGKQVGTVEQVLIDPHRDRATSLVIAQGLLVKERRRVPINWVSEVKEDEIHLAVGSPIIDELGFVP
jgi:sporulation protein YlmC with PRC-barrel domain